MSGKTEKKINALGAELAKLRVVVELLCLQMEILANLSTSPQNKKEAVR